MPSDITDPLYFMTPIDSASRLIQIGYNLILVLLFIIALPLILPMIWTTPKWRFLIYRRCGWHTYYWEGKRTVPAGRTLWIHALSVGEVMAAQPLIQQIQTQQAFEHVVLSTSTLSGYQTAARIFAEQGIDLAIFPYDWLRSVRQVSDKIKPDAVIIVETDIWPNFLWEMKKRDVPVFLANVRLSDSSWSCYRRFKLFAGGIFNAFSKISVQTDNDFTRFKVLGVPADRLRVTGNIKFDAPVQEENPEAAATLRRRLRVQDRQPIIVAGSTHEGEEAYLIAALSAVKQRSFSPLMIIAPRDPQRYHHVLKLVAGSGLTAERYSTFRPGTQAKAPMPDIIVVDIFGVLKTMYTIADIAFVGGSMVAQGGHNPLEPAACGKTVLFGPDMRDFKQIAAWLLQADAARQVDTPALLEQEITWILTDLTRAREMGQRALRVYQSHKGAIERTLDFFELR